MDIKKLDSQNIWANKRSPFSSYSWSKGLPGKEDFEERRSFITLRNNGLQKHLPRLHYLGGRLKMLQHQQLDLPGVSCQFNLSPCTISIKRKKKTTLFPETPWFPRSHHQLISDMQSAFIFLFFCMRLVGCGSVHLIIMCFFPKRASKMLAKRTMTTGNYRRTETFPFPHCATLTHI